MSKKLAACYICRHTEWVPDDQPRVFCPRCALQGRKNRMWTSEYLRNKAEVDRGWAETHHLVKPGEPYGIADSLVRLADELDAKAADGGHTEDTDV